MKIDLKRDRRDLYRPGTTEFTEVTVPPMTYLAVDGHGDPNTSTAYTEAVQALYTSAYAVRAACIARSGDDFVVGPLEGLWSSADPAAFMTGTKDAWDWTMLIPLPDCVTTADVETGLAVAGSRKPELSVGRVRLLELNEGRCLQIMHVGRYADEAGTLARLHAEVMPAGGLTWNGRHHEIYLSDPRRVAEEKLLTVLRQPVKPAR